MPLSKKTNKKTNAKKSVKNSRNHARSVKKASRTPVPIVAAGNKTPRQINRAKKMLEAKKADDKEKREVAAEELKKVEGLLDNQAFLRRVSSEVGLAAVDILKSLAKSHKTDEELAVQMSSKVNDVRRMLNVMNSYSIVRYDVNKDSKGWLIFTWRIDGEKLQEYIVEMSKTAPVYAPALPDNCNDFFICKKCYTTDKVVLPFDSAFEAGFACGCGKSLSILNREQTLELFKSVTGVPV